MYSNETINPLSRWFPIILLVVITQVAFSSVQAATLAEVDLPDQATVGSKTVVLNGLGLRTATMFKVKEKIIMNVAGSIGTKMAMDISYNTEATFDFENQTKLEYAGEEDEIIKKIEAGNVSMPLPGSLISGSQSLFGLKTELQFGKLTLTSVFSQQRGESSVISVEGGAQLQDYSVTIDDYDANKHFFLSDYFRDNYNRALSRLPIITSEVSITKMEIWVTNKTTNFDDARNIVATTDLAEYDPKADLWKRDPSQVGEFPRNALNNAYKELTTTYSDIRESPKPQNP